jgi:glycosyltransferase involved in cell wall biosynthesis
MSQPRETERPLPVLFLVPNLPTGGAERQLSELVTRMNRERFRPVVVCQKGGGPFFDEIVAGGIEAHALELHAKYDPRFVWRLAKICRERRARVIVARSFSTGVVGRVVGRLLGIPVVMAEHSTGRIDHDPKKRPIERLFAPLTDGVIAVARGQIPFLVEDKGFRESQIRVIYNGIDLTDWNPAPRDAGVCDELGLPLDAPVVGILAMLRPEKDHATFVKAAKIVLAERPETRFLIVGDGSERPSLEALAADLGIADRVIFTGRRADVRRLLTVFDVSVLASVTIETFPMSFLEAMAMERPLVATRVGGVPEMIEEGENGYLVPLRDAPALAAALLKVITDRETVRKMGARSRAIVEEKFTVERMVRDTEEYLDSFV